MSGFNLITSNYLEILAEKLAELLKTRPLISPLAPEVVIVQSQGMARWLSLALADHVGICANYRFPFPNTFIRGLFTSADKEPLQKSIYDNDVVTLKAMKALPELIERREFAALRSYLKDDNRGLKLYQLAGKIADTFEQYTVYRPELIYNWENGKDNNWQAILWRTLMADASQKHLAALAYDFLKNVRLPNFSLTGLPERVSVFGIPSLPPMYIQLFLGLSRFTDIYYYVMNPCREFWADIVSDRETERIARKYKEPIESPEKLYLEKGNSLLASMGSLGRDFFDALSQENIEDSQFFHEPEPATMLAAIQTDILTLNERGKNDSPKLSVDGDDHSIQIHSCHSPMREIEVLHDNLLAMFDHDKELTPRDILVMTPISNSTRRLSRRCSARRKTRRQRSRSASPTAVSTVKARSSMLSMSFWI
jgi:exodeoxyribonuclease V gamma subunit